MQAQTLSIYSLVKPKSWWMEIPVLLGFNILLAATAYISINLPFSPVPITGQTFGVLLIAMALGRTRGVGLVTAYLIEGAMGLPVFAGGAAGPQVLIGPTGGYLFGFLGAAYLVGALADRGWDRNLVKSVTAMTLGTAVIFTTGLAQLSLFVPMNLLATAGLIPYLPGAVVKIAVAAAILPAVWKFLGK